ncbi:MAG: hypothetical protein OHK0011_14680 [Turneriella sp.]
MPLRFNMILASSALLFAPAMALGPDYSLEKTVDQGLVMVRLLDDTVLADVLVMNVSAEQVRLASTGASYETGPGPLRFGPFAETDAVVQRRRIFRIYLRGEFYSDFPLSQEEHKKYSTYLEYAQSAGDYVTTANGTLHYGRVLKETADTLTLAYSEGEQEFDKHAVRSWRIAGKITTNNNFAAVSERDLDAVAADFASSIPVSYRGQALGIDPLKATGGRGHEIIAERLGRKLGAALLSERHSVFNRDNLRRVISEKELAQQGLLAGKDRTLESTKQIDLLISGAVRPLADRSGISIQLEATATQNLAIVATLERRLPYEDTDLPLKAEFSEHRGLFLNLSIGSGYGIISTSGFDALNSLTLDGTAFMTQLRGGFALDNKIILGLNLTGNVLNEPLLDASPDILTEKRLTGRFMNYTVWGPFVQRYFADNYFASATLGAASAFYKDIYQSLEVSHGFGAGLSLGKEWQIARHFGLGLALHINYAYVPLRDIDTAFRTTTGTTIADKDFSLSMWSAQLALSVTFN